MDYSVKISTILQIEKRKWLFLVGLVGLTHLLCQSLILPYGNALRSMVPDSEINEIVRESKVSKLYSVKTEIVDNLFMGSTPSLGNESSFHEDKVESKLSNAVGGDIDDVKKVVNKKKDMKRKLALDGNEMDDDDFVEDETLDDRNVDLEEWFIVQNDSISQMKLVESSQNFSLPQFVKEGSGDITMVVDVSKSKDNISIDSPASLSAAVSSPDIMIVSENVAIDESTLKGSTLNVSSDKTKGKIDVGHHLLLGNNLASSSNNSSTTSSARKKMRCEMPPKTVTTNDEMQHLLVRHRARSRAMKPRWSSERDQEILAAKLKIESAPALVNDVELYAPLYRNVSMFKRSYELMERVLKVYVYKEGEKPIFHQPRLKGLYASEGWFMKLMEGNRNFAVKDPQKAHLFYMPFSSRMLEHTLYVRNSHNRTNLRQYLKNYSEMIAAKYRMWNRTGGADHFLVACHDWAPYETRHHMEHCIKALCNADVTMGFKIGRDVSFPETYVRSARNPLRDLGGNPPTQRNILAFYAGNMHGYLRPILLEHWKDKDPDMKIFGPMPPGVASKMNYIQHMKSSKYCICPKGYEVNSPRVVEAIFYECIPVIISDNFVPSFFEVLNWDAFSLILAEKDIPNLRSILVSIPEERYMEMQLAVRKVQRHFLWHVKPLKYDIFHMTLHSIWYNRVFQIKAR